MNGPPAVRNDFSPGDSRAVSSRFEQPDEEREYVSFAVGDAHFGVDIQSVHEIRSWSEVTHLPLQPDYMRGLMNLRGAIIPVIDLRARLAEGLTSATASHVVIIVQTESRKVGVLVDEVLDIVTIRLTDIQPLPAMTGENLEFLSGLAVNRGGLIALIDLRAVLSGPGAVGRSRACDAA